MIDKKDKRTIYGVVILMVIFSLYVVINIINMLRYIGGNPKDIVYNIKIDDDNNNTVYLKPNDFIDKNPASLNASYISSLVDHIDTRFKYLYQGDKLIDMNYLYNIKAVIIGEYISEKAELITSPIWQKEFLLLDDQVGTSNKDIAIDQRVNIDLAYYNGLVANFQSILNIPLNARLEVKLSIFLDGNLMDTYPVKRDYYMLTTIPLGVKAFDIAISKNFVEREKVYNKEPKKTDIIYAITILYIVVLIAINLLGIYLIRKITNRTRNQYDATIERLLKDYGDRIVTIDNFIDDKNLDTIDVANFNEIINLADETLEPILFWEKKDKKGKEAWFAILRNKIIYRYIYKNKK